MALPIVLKSITQKNQKLFNKNTKHKIFIYNSLQNITVYENVETTKKYTYSVVLFKVTRRKKRVSIF